MVKVLVIEDDISNKPVILTFANPIGKWYGGVDKAIQHRFGEIYHDQLREQWASGHFGLGSTVVVESDEEDEPTVIFVCDSVQQQTHQRPLKEVIYPALELAFKHGVTSLAVPALRTGPGYLFVDGYDYDKAEKELVETLLGFPQELEIIIVVYNDSEQAQRLRKYLAK